jgi:hypothetical protein
MKSDFNSALAQLDDYVRGVQSGEHASAYEDDLFARALADDATELAFRAALGSTLLSMGARGTLDLWLTRRDLERVLTSGLRVIQFELDLARLSLPDLSVDFDLIVTKIPLDLTGIRRLDAEIFTPDGVLLKTMPDIAFDPADRAVYACCEAELARTAASARTITRVWATDDQGRRLLTEIGGS